MAAVLTVAAFVMCLLNLLDSDSLTRISTRMANRALDADVTLGRVELSMMHSMPFLRLDVDSLTIVSRDMRRLPADLRAKTPAWADTLLTLSHFHGGIDVLALMHNHIVLNDVVFDEPAVNIVTVNDSISNYLIYKSAPEAQADTVPSAIPHIRINSFSVNRPHNIRYYNAHTGEHFDVALKPITLDGGAAPTYSLHMGGNVSSPGLALYNLNDMAFGVNGSMGWDPDRPSELELRDFDLSAAFLRAKVNAHIDFGRDLIVRDFDLNLGKMGISRILDVLPDSLRRAYGLEPDKFDSDLEVSFTARSTAPFNLTTDSVPSADLLLTLSPGQLRYGNARFSRVAGAFGASLKGNDLGRATFSASDFNVVGPATDLTLNAEVSQITTDPLVTGKLHGSTDLERLPEILTRMLQGYISGQIVTDISFTGRPSMLTRNSFHKLRVDGSMTGRDIYYLSGDTNNMVYMHRLALALGTNSRVKTRSGQWADSLLTATVSVDSADVLSNNISMSFTGLKLGAGASNRRQSADTTMVIPMGGHLELGSFSLLSISDSIVFKLREAAGTVAMTRYNGEARRPQFSTDLSVRRMAVGDRDSRFMLSRAQVSATAYKLPKRKVPEKIRHTADSLHRAYPDLPMDSVYRYAIRKHRSGHHRKYPRVHPEYTDAETEIINWGTSHTLRRLLLGWHLEGNATARRAGMFTPYFPIRNRVRDFNVHFNTDSVVLSKVRYKAGHSDFLISGRISNIKRTFTSRGYRSPIKLNFQVVSDTIEVDELASATFRGSAYAADTVHRRSLPEMDMARLEAAEAMSDAQFEKELGRVVENSPDSMAPLLIPTNVDLQLDMKASNIIYSDMLFHDFNGLLLAYRGALNLHHMTAGADFGKINLSALYSAPNANDLSFGFGLQVNDFMVHRFTELMPSLDSIMPMLQDFRGKINGDVAATCRLDRGMNFMLPTLNAAIRLEGDSLAIIDKETYRKIGKWLLFKDKQSNIIDHMNVQLTIADNQMQLYPFIFDIDRYRLGVQGHNDIALNFDYHIAVLKSPLPFRFGINIKGNPDKYKIRIGRARFNEKSVATTVAIVDTARVNLLNQIENIFRRGVAGSRFARVSVAGAPSAASIDLNADTISHADSLVFIREGLIPAPLPSEPAAQENSDKKKKSKSKPAKKTKSEATLPKND